MSEFYLKSTSSYYLINNTRGAQRLHPQEKYREPEGRCDWGILLLTFLMLQTEK